MKVTRALLWILLFLNGGRGESAPPERPVENFKLLDHRGRSRELYRYSDAKAIVLIGQGNGCPIVRKYVPAIAALRDQFGRKGVEFLMINPNVQDSRDETAREADELGIDIPILMDESQIIAEALGLTRASEALLIDARTWRIVYRGAIDDRIGFGGTKPKALNQHLKDAIDDLLAGRNVETKETAASGCLFNLEKATSGLTFVEDAGPILRAKCADCHTRGERDIPDFSTYEQVRGFAPMIREVIRTKRMPPWSADPHYGQFKNSLALSAEETRILVRWVEDGALRGIGKDPLAIGRASESGQPELRLSLDEQVIPATGNLASRYFQVSSSPTARDLWVRETEIKSNFNVAHHATLYICPKPLTEFEQFKGEFKKLPGKIVLGHHGCAWVGSPGKNRRGPLIDGYANFAPRGYFTIEMHYDPSGTEERDKTEFLLHLHKGKHPPKKLRVTLISPVDYEDFAIPPGAREFRSRAEHRFNNSVEILGMNVHMHNRGARALVTVEYPDGKRETLLSIPDFSTKVPPYYLLAKPLRLPAGTTLTAEWTFDNSSQNPNNPDASRSVSWGPKASDEMALVYILYGD